MRLVKMNKRSRYHGIACMYCHRPVADGRVALCSTYYVYPSLQDGNWSDRAAVWGYSVNESRERQDAKNPVIGQKLTDYRPAEIKVKVVYHRKCMEKILTNPRGPYDPEVVASMYDEYREQLLERFEERKPGQVRYPSEVSTVSGGGRDRAEVDGAAV